MNDRTEFLVVEDIDLEYVRQVSADHHLTLRELPAEGFEPVTAVTLMLIGSGAAVGAVVDLIERRKGGQVIDLRPGAPKSIYRTPDLLFGLVMIQRQDGMITVDVKEPRGMFGQLMDALRDVLGKIAGESLQVARKTVADAVGDAADVTATTHWDET